MSEIPSVETSAIGVRRIVIDVPLDSVENEMCRTNDEVILFGLVCKPRWITDTAQADARSVWELRALREVGAAPV